QWRRGRAGGFCHRGDNLRRYCGGGGSSGDGGSRHCGSRWTGSYRLVGRRQGDGVPIWMGRQLEIAGEIREAFDLGGQDGGFSAKLVGGAHGVREFAGVAGARALDIDDLALADEAGGELGGTTVLAGGASEDEAVAAILDDGLGVALAVSG